MSPFSQCSLLPKPEEDLHCTEITPLSAGRLELEFCSWSLNAPPPHSTHSGFWWHKSRPIAPTYILLAVDHPTGSQSPTSILWRLVTTQLARCIWHTTLPDAWLTLDWITKWRLITWLKSINWRRDSAGEKKNIDKYDVGRLLIEQLQIHKMLAGNYRAASD